MEYAAWWLGSDSPLYAVTIFVWVYACFRLLADSRLRDVPWLVQSPSHYASIDGLRGYLALGVVLHHAVITFYAQHGSAWQNPPSRFYTLIGQCGVALFFMITGFLFWQKAVNSGGNIRWKALYSGRFKRLTPAYIFSLVCVVLAVMMPWGVHHLSDITWKDVVQNAVLFKGLRTVSDVNGVYWSLVWEWRYYLALPLVAYAVRWWRGWGAVLPALAVMGYVLWKPENAVVLNFVAGGVAVYARVWWLRMVRATWLWDVVFIGALVVFFCVFDTGYGWLQSVVLYFCFQSVVCGASVFGVLHHAASRMLGAISYSIYLLHCVVLYVVVHSMRQLGISVAQMDFFTYMTVLPWLVGLVLMVALMSYRYFEYPFMTKPSVS